MKIWAIADLHLSFGDANKSMDIFGPQWVGYTDQIEKNWRASIVDEDLVLIAGDISWAMRPELAKVDLGWIESLPGTKVMIRGNHDYWWTSLSKVRAVLPPSIHVIQNDVFEWNDICIGGARLWDTEEFNFNGYIEYRENPKAIVKEKNSAEQKKIFEREIQRLEVSLKQLNQKAKMRIVMTHYPPISATMEDSIVSGLLEKYNVDICVFGHLHSVKKGVEMFGTKNSITYLLTSCDFLDFNPLIVYPC